MCSNVCLPGATRLEVSACGASTVEADNLNSAQTRRRQSGAEQLETMNVFEGVCSRWKCGQTKGLAEEWDGIWGRCLFAQALDGLLGKRKEVSRTFRGERESEFVLGIMSFPASFPTGPSSWVQKRTCVGGRMVICWVAGLRFWLLAQVVNLGRRQRLVGRCRKPSAFRNSPTNNFDGLKLSRAKGNDSHSFCSSRRKFDAFLKLGRHSERAT